MDWGGLMTDLQKEKIIELRHEGSSYAEISAEIGIPKETVKSFCRRNGMVTQTPKAAAENACRNCGNLIVQNPKVRKKVFCSAVCRTAWWKANPHSATANRTCAYCGKSFSAYGNSVQKYCSHSCYISARFGKGALND